MLGGGSRVKYWFIYLAAIIYEGCKVVTSWKLLSLFFLDADSSLYFLYTNLQIDTKDILFICGGAFVGLEKTISER